MAISFKTSKFYPDEMRLLKTFKSKTQRESGSKLRYHHFLIAALSGGIFTYLATLAHGGFWVLPLGIIAVLAFAFIVFAPLEVYKKHSKNKRLLNQLNNSIDKGTVDTFLVNAIKIALAKEYEDEGDLFIIEYEPDKLLYLWDYDYQLRKSFPCLQFEIYQPGYALFFGRQVYPLSERITPLIIDKKAKWNYMDKVGTPVHLQTEAYSFDKLIADINSYA